MVWLLLAAGRGALDVRRAVTDRDAAVVPVRLELSVAVGLGVAVGVGVLEWLIVGLGAAAWVSVADARGAELLDRLAWVVIRAARLIGANTGRGVRATAAGGCDGAAVGRLAARPMPSATTAQPPTATDARQADTTRPTDM